MTDFNLSWSATSGAADLTYEDADLQLDGGLEGAVLLSLFCGIEGGWWGDAFPAVANDTFGSQLWQLAREKDTPATLRRAQEITEQALAWFVEDKVAASVAVVVTSVAPTLAVSVTITRSAAAPTVYLYSYNWVAQELRHGV